MTDKEFANKLREFVKHHTYSFINPQSGEKVLCIDTDELEQYFISKLDKVPVLELTPIPRKEIKFFKDSEEENIWRQGANK